MSRILWILQNTDDYKTLLGFRLGMAIAFLTVHSLLCLLLAQSSRAKVSKYYFTLMALSCIFLDLWNYF